MNKITLIGNVVNELELKNYERLNGEGSYVNFTLAVNDHRNKDNNTIFINVVAFGKKAEVISKYVIKGSKLAVDGRLSHDNYINKDGEKRYGFKVILEDVQFLDSKKVI